MDQHQGEGGESVEWMSDYNGISYQFNILQLISHFGPILLFNSHANHIHS